MRERIGQAEALALAGRDAINFATQAKEFGILDKVFVAGVSFVTDNNVKTLGATAKGIWGIINYSSTLDTPENKAFVEAWKKKYNGEEPASFEGETYLGMQVIFQAVEKAKSVKPADVRTARQAIVATARRLEEEGTIVIARPDEDE